MRILPNKPDNTRVVELHIELEIPPQIASFQVDERILSHYLRRKESAKLKGEIRTRMVAQVYTSLSNEVLLLVDEALEKEWHLLNEYFPNALPIEVNEEKPKKTVRCSKQLSQSELEDLRQKLLADLGAIY